MAQQLKKENEWKEKNEELQKKLAEVLLQQQSSNNKPEKTFTKKKHFNRPQQQQQQQQQQEPIRPPKFNKLPKTQQIPPTTFTPGARVGIAEMDNNIRPRQQQQQQQQQQFDNRYYDNNNYNDNMNYYPPPQQQYQQPTQFDLQQRTHANRNKHYKPPNSDVDQIMGLYFENKNETLLQQLEQRNFEHKLRCQYNNNNNNNNNF